MLLMLIIVTCLVGIVYGAYTALMFILVLAAVVVAVGVLAGMAAVFVILRGLGSRYK